MQVTRLPVGTRLYRGVGDNRELPDVFSRSDAFGCRGFVELSFLSTSVSRAVAVRFSEAKMCGIKDGVPMAKVFEIETDSVNRGACVADFSQFPSLLPDHPNLLS